WVDFFDLQQIKLPNQALVSHGQRLVQLPRAGHLIVDLLQRSARQHQIKVANPNAFLRKLLEKIFDLRGSEYPEQALFELPEFFFFLNLDASLLEAHWDQPSIKNLERETGIEPATNSLEGCDSTTELLPHISCQLSAVSYQLATSDELLASSDHVFQPTKTLEPMTRIELVTSPLPRECSTN